MPIIDDLKCKSANFFLDFFLLATCRRTSNWQFSLIIEFRELLSASELPATFLLCKMCGWSEICYLNRVRFPFRGGKIPKKNFRYRFSKSDIQTATISIDELSMFSIGVNFRLLLVASQLRLNFNLAVRLVANPSRKLSSIHYSTVDIAVYSRASHGELHINIYKICKQPARWELCDNGLLWISSSSVWVLCASS